MDICDRVTLRFVRECHPCVCPAYNSAAGCHLGDTCFKLHVCNNYILECCNGAAAGCQLTHNLHSEHSKRIYKHYMLMDIAFKPELKYIFAWLIMPLNAASEHNGENAARRSLGSTSKSTRPTLASKNDAAARASLGRAAVPSKAAAAVPAAAPGVWSKVSSVDVVLKFLIARGGSANWQEFCTHFALPAGTQFPTFERHLRQLATRDRSFSGRNYQLIHGLEFSSGHTTRSIPDAVDMFRFIRICGNWQRARNKCAFGHTCDHLHVCRNWLAGECAASGDGCPLGHAFAASVVSKLPFPLDWSLDRMRQFVRMAHPRLCAAYNSPEGCANAECARVHLCNEFLLERCDAAECTRSHDFCSGNNVTIYKRFGIQDLPLHPGVKHLFGWLLMPVLNASLAATDGEWQNDAEPELESVPQDEPEPEPEAEAASLSSPTTPSTPEDAPSDVTANALSRLSIGSRDGADAKNSPRTKKGGRRSRRSPKKSAQSEEQTAAASNGKNSSGGDSRQGLGAKPAAGVGAIVQAPVPPQPPSKKPFICESLLRGVCGLDESCEYFHVETSWDSALFPDEEPSEAAEAEAEGEGGGAEREPVLLNYFWQYRVPREWTSKPGFEAATALEDESLTADGWLSFDWSEEEALEKAFIDPSQDSLMLQVEKRYSYCTMLYSFCVKCVKSLQFRLAILL